MKIDFLTIERKLSHIYTSGYWASRAFERILRNECRRLLGFVPKDESREHGNLEYMIMCLCQDKHYHRQEKLLFELKQLRNDAVHEESSFNRIKAQLLIEGVRELENMSRAGA